MDTIEIYNTVSDRLGRRGGESLRAAALRVLCYGIGDARTQHAARRVWDIRGAEAWPVLATLAGAA